MIRLKRLLEKRSALAWLLLAATALVIGGFVGTMTKASNEQYRLKLLQNEVQSTANEMMALVMNGQLVAAIGATGIVDIGLWQDGKDNALLGKIGHALEADSVFIFNRSGIVNSAWHQNGSQSVGTNISDRPYFREAMNDKNSVHVAADATSGERGISFSTPLRAPSGRPVGALVAHTGLKRLNALLAKHTDLALLLSPQGIVFASTRSEWVGRPSTPLASEHGAEPPANALLLPAGDAIAELDDQRYAFTRSEVHWNDPDGAWSLILAENLSRTAASSARILPAIGAALASFLFGAIALILLRQQHAREATARTLQASAELQESRASSKARITEASLRFQQTSSPQTLAECYLQTTRALLGVLQGSVYLAATDTAGGLSLLAGFACNTAIPRTLKFGEGLLGQCAAERKARVVTGLKPDYWTADSALCTTLPTEIRLLPILRQEHLLGVVELAPAHALSPEAENMAEELTMLLSLNLEIHLRNEKTRQLLEETRRQTLEMTEQSAELARQRVTLFALIETIPDPIATKDSEGIYVDCNTAFAKSVERSKEEILGHTDADIYPPQEANRIRRLDTEQIARRQHLTDPERIGFADGKRYQIETLCAPFYDTEERLIGLLSIGRTRHAEAEKTRHATPTPTPTPEHRAARRQKKSPGEPGRCVSLQGTGRTPGKINTA